MGKLIHFPSPQQASAHPRVRRVFEAQREFEKAQHQTQMMMLGAFLTASAMVVVLSVIASIS